MKKYITCIVCPRGCNIEIDHKDDEVISITGYSCKRGLEYVNSELTDPRRTVTSTVRAENGSVVAVKTNKAIPKKLIFECMDKINRVRPTLPIHVGDVIIKDILGTGADLVATQNKE